MSQEWTSDKINSSSQLGSETGPCVVRDYLELYMAEMSILPTSISRQREHESSTLSMCQESAAHKTWLGKELNWKELCSLLANQQ